MNNRVAMNVRCSQILTNDLIMNIAHLSDKQSDENGFAAVFERGNRGLPHGSVTNMLRLVRLER